jgi:hypothetical protein
MAAPRSFEKIIQLIKPMAEYIGVFLASLDNCLTPDFASDIIKEECEA